MSVLVSTVLNRVATVLNDLGKVRWTQAELLDWLNEGQQALVKIPAKADAKVTTAEMTLAAGSRQSLPADGVALVAVQENVGGAAVTLCDKTTLDAFSPAWRTRPTASSAIHFMSGEKPEAFYVYPAQSTTPARVVLTYLAKPKTVTATDAIDVRDLYADSLVNYVLYRALSKDAEVGHAERAAAYYQAFLA